MFQSPIGFIDTAVYLRQRRIGREFSPPFTHFKALPPETGARLPFPPTESGGPLRGSGDQAGVPECGRN